MGAVQFKGWSSVNYDSLTTGFQFAASGSTNSPVSTLSFMVFTSGSGDRAQLAISLEEVRVYARSNINGTWNSWVRIDNA